MRCRVQFLGVIVLLCGLFVPSVGKGANARPNIILVSVDTLRADRMSIYGYSRQTSPNIDRLLTSGALFQQARTVEPLTAPALASMLTSLPPHDHGCTRNGLRVRSELPSVARVLRRQGYRTSAFVGSWTLRDKLWGMAAHFDQFEDVLTKARWFGMVKREASAEDINERAIAWVNQHYEEDSRRPFFLWVHYVEPHAPYKLQREFLDQLGPSPDGDLYSSKGRYDTEIAYVDFHAASFVDTVQELVGKENTIVVFVADHGESLGEHGYWGHGRHLYDATLHIPMGIVWQGRIEPMKVSAPALISDVGPTILGLVDVAVPDYLGGFDWSGVLTNGDIADEARVTHYQAHKGSVNPKEEQVQVRQGGLLEVARIEESRKEILRVTNQRKRLFDVANDPQEEVDLATDQSAISESLRNWLETVRQGLELSDELPPPSLTDEDVEALRALGYID